MPTYEYICEKCHQRFETLVIGTDDSKVVCEVCGAAREHLNKRLSVPSFFFRDKDGNPDKDHKGRI